MANDLNETQMNDDQFLYFGDGNDIGIKWDNTNSRLVLGDGTNEFWHITDDGTTGTLEIQDNCKIAFGNDADFDVKFNTTSGDLEFTDGTNVLASISAASEFTCGYNSGLPLIVWRDTSTATDRVNMAFQMKDSAGNATSYGSVRCQLLTNTDTAEDGALEFGVVEAGTFTNYLVMDGASADIEVNKVFDYKWTMGTGSDNPAVDAPTDWIECKIAGTTRYIPVYT